jgi:hypothetical protein
LALGKIEYAPCNSRPSVEVSDVRKGASELVLEERKVGAGEDDGVDAIAVGRVEERLGRRSNSVDADLLSGELGFGELDELG